MSCGSVRGTGQRRFICECREVRRDDNRRHRNQCGCGCGGHREERDVVLSCRCREANR